MAWWAGGGGPGADGLGPARLPSAAGELHPAAGRQRWWVGSGRLAGLRAGWWVGWASLLKKRMPSGGLGGKRGGAAAAGGGFCEVEMKENTRITVLPAIDRGLAHNAPADSQPAGRSATAASTCRASPAAGLLVGLGTSLGSGCTSGHGICGLSRLAPRSLAATLTFMASGAAVAAAAGTMAATGADVGVHTSLALMGAEQVRGQRAVHTFLAREKEGRTTLLLSLCALGSA